MSGFFLMLCTLLSNILNPIILMLMLFELGLGVIVGWQLVRLKREINRLNASGRRENKRTLKKGRGKISTTFESISEKDWNDFDAFLGEYQRDLVTSNFFSLLIQIFPLLGILGTVAGLYIAINSGQDIYDGVKFALSSTVYGIMAAVLFKIADIIFTARFLNYIDDGIDRFEKNYHVVSQEAFQDAANEKPRGREPVSALSEALPSKSIPLQQAKNARGNATQPTANSAPPQQAKKARGNAAQPTADSIPLQQAKNARGNAAQPTADSIPLQQAKNARGNATQPSVTKPAGWVEEDFQDFQGFQDEPDFPESESLRKSQAEAKGVADKIAGWRKKASKPAGD